MRWIIKILWICLAVCIGGCSGGRYRLSASTPEHIDSTDVVVGVGQHEINARIVGSYAAVAMGGGLIPALIDASVEQGQANKAEKLLQPLRDNLIDYDFAAVLKTIVSEKLTKISWLRPREVILERETGDEWMLEHFQQSSASVILYIEASYELGARFRKIFLACKVIMLPRDENLRVMSGSDKRKNPVSFNNRIYYKEFEVFKEFDLGKMKYEAAVEALAADNAEKVRMKFDEAAEEISTQIAENLEKTVMCNKK